MKAVPVRNQGRVIGVGYGSAQGRAEIIRLMETEPDALIVDVRLSPRSRLPGWSGHALAARWPGRYVHVPALGNRRFRERSIAGEPPIAIVNLPAGLAALRQLAAAHKLVILLCGCADGRRCHRQVILEAYKGGTQGGTP